MARTPTMIQPHPSHNSRCGSCGTLHPLNVHWSHAGGPHTGAASHAYFKARAGIPAHESPRKGGRKPKRAAARKGTTRKAAPMYGPMTAAQDWDARFAASHKRAASHHCPDGDCGHASHGHRMAADSGRGKAKKAAAKRKKPTANRTKAATKKASPKKTSKKKAAKKEPKTKTINLMKMSAADRAAVGRCLARVKSKKK